MSNRMWKDSEAEFDLLGFNFLAEQVVELAKDENLSPATVGVYGDWGSGKSSLMKMVKKLLDSDKKTLTVEFNGWLFEGYEDAKTALCGTILDEMYKHETLFAKGKEKIKELLKKVDGGKLLSKGVKYGLDYLLTGGIGTLTEFTLKGIIEVVRQKANDVSEEDVKKLIGSLKSEKKRTEIKEFRNEFKKVFEGCRGDRLVVFIDELDRCKPDTILDIFEAIRLFLYVEGTTFIIGADERLVSYAVKTKYLDIPGHDIDISKEYLEKLVQYPVKIPQLNEKEVKQYITCLLLQNEIKEFGKVAESVSKLGINDEFTINTVKATTGREPTEGMKEAFDLSNQIYSALSTLMKGNPRHCKRFFNTLMMRVAMAERRGIALQKKALAKLMLAEYYKPGFIDVLMQTGSREELKQLEDGHYDAEFKVLKDWSNDEWVKNWAKGSPLLSKVENLNDYFYFSRESRKLYSSNVEVLSNEAKRLLQDLMGSSESVRGKAVGASKQLAPAEQVLLVNALMDELVREEKIDGGKFNSCLELATALNLQKDVVERMKTIPVNRISAGLVGQMTSFVKTLDENTKVVLRSYLETNIKLTKPIEAIFK